MPTNQPQLSTQTMPYFFPLLLPTEIMALLITASDPDALPAISVVFRLFHQLAFPLIHRTVSFKRASQIKVYIKIVRGEEADASLRISRAL
jgi:hypothetical protein